jgi:hypothetical protein
MSSTDQLEISIIEIEKVKWLKFITVTVWQVIKHTEKQIVVIDDIWCKKGTIWCDPARLTKDIALRSGQTVIFDEVVTNNGHAYNKDTGHFIANNVAFLKINNSIDWSSGRMIRMCHSPSNILAIFHHLQMCTPTLSKKGGGKVVRPVTWCYKIISYTGPVLNQLVPAPTVSCSSICNNTLQALQRTAIGSSTF